MSFSRLMRRHLIRPLTIHARESAMVSRDELRLLGALAAFQRKNLQLLIDAETSESLRVCAALLAADSHVLPLSDSIEASFRPRVGWRLPLPEKVSGKKTR